MPYIMRTSTSKYRHRNPSVPGTSTKLDTMAQNHLPHYAQPSSSQQDYHFPTHQFTQQHDQYHFPPSASQPNFSAPLSNAQPVPVAAPAMNPASTASLRLHYYQQVSRREGESEFDRGVGQRQRTDDLMLSRSKPTDAATRKRRKTRSAYVSRYAAKSYARLLEHHVRDADDELAALRVSVDGEARRLRAAREMLDEIERRLGRTQGTQQQVPGEGSSRANKRAVEKVEDAGSFVSELTLKGKRGTVRQGTQQQQPRSFFGGGHAMGQRTSAVWQDVLDYAIADGRKEVAGSDVSASECDNALFSRGTEGVAQYVRETHC